MTKRERKQFLKLLRLAKEEYQDLFDATEGSNNPMYELGLLDVIEACKELIKEYRHEWAERDLPNK